MWNWSVQKLSSAYRFLTVKPRLARREMSAATAVGPEAKFRFNSNFTSKLPGDPVEDNNPRQVRKAFWTKVSPKPSRTPLELVSFSNETAELLDVKLDDQEKEGLLEYLVGNKMFPSAQPWAQAYAGFQFGSFAGQLGDGRAISIGEIVNSKGESYELQFKGAGPTPFGRGFDGRAVLRSSIREFLCSEAMHYLGVPTTRALSLVATGTTVIREEPERGAVVVRVAPTWIRFGTFELQFYTKHFQLVGQLADYVIEHHYPELAKLGPEDKYVQFYTEIVRCTAHLVAQWQSIGWAHGVLNTDNTHILGLTLDYGPFGFLDEYDPDFICNHSDHTGRYSFQAQPEVLMWNLGRLAFALSPVVDYDVANQILTTKYWEEYFSKYYSLMRTKMGIFEQLEEDDVFDKEYLSEILSLMESAKVDWTIFWRKLSAQSTPAGEQALVDMFDPRKKANSCAVNEPQRGQIVDESSRVEILEPENVTKFKSWLKKLRERQSKESISEPERVTKMNAANPKYILRNFLAQRAIEAAEGGDYSKVNMLFEILKRPFDEQPEHEAEYAGPAPDWAREICVSCSS